MTQFKTLETATAGSTYQWEEILESIKFDDNGLIPGIAQQYDSHEVLMMAWLNKDALKDTLLSGRVCYWSRSRQKLWKKGETSGQVQRLKGMRFDCDGDAILLLVDQTGPACHTGRRSCFYLAVENNQASILTDPVISPEELYKT